jgi:hypothetical protein
MEDCEMEIHATNVNQALAQALRLLKLDHTEEQSRNGPVWVFPEPVMTIYDRPQERVLFSPLRDANPFFHLMESLWMLAGREDVAFPAYFAKNVANYSDDGVTLHGAYGRRWRSSFGFDQLLIIARELREKPETRRCVLQMWDTSRWIAGHSDDEELGFDDLRKATAGGKDVPCNTHIYFDARGGVLNMTVLCRSNDLWWGCYGANAVHFSVLQEVMAAWVGVPVGVYRQFSNNLHLYTDNVDVAKLDDYIADAELNDEYLNCGFDYFPLVRGGTERWLAELDQFMKDPMNEYPFNYDEPFFPTVAIPMYRAWWLRKHGKAPHEITLAAKDWEYCANSWLARRTK